MSPYAYLKQEPRSNEAVHRTDLKRIQSGISNSDKLAQLYALGAIENQDSAAFGKDVIQRLVDGKTCALWLKSHRLKGKKEEKFKKFFDMVHQESAFIFFTEELDSYCEQYFVQDYSEINWDDIMDFEKFKKYVAMLRDPEGAHGGLRHTHEGAAGTRYIYDRVMRGAEKASYLPLDTFLAWDSKLRKNHGEIFDAYVKQADKLIDIILKNANNRTLAALRTAAAPIHTSVNIDIDGDEILNLTLISSGGDIQPKDQNYSFAVKATITSNQQVPSISITQADASKDGERGAKAGRKNPEAHTGGLAPVFTINDNDSVDNLDKITADMLKWVTKY